METATVRMVSWLLVAALIAPLALPAAASSAYANSEGGKTALMSPAPGAEAGMDPAWLPEAEISRSAASQPVTATQPLSMAAVALVDPASVRGEARTQPSDEAPPDEIDAGGDDVGGYLATVLGAAPDLWTGNSSFVYPLELPAGPGGFAPSLSLNYSSEVANSITLRHGATYEVQASLPGYGWSLGVPSISSSGPNWLERRYFLTLGGRSYELVDDRRTMSSLSSDITLVAEKWLWMGGTNAGQVVKTYSLGGRPVAVNRGGEWTYLFQDHLGSPALETDYDGRAGFRWKYEPYGTMRASEWTLPIDRGFTGQVIEPGLGLHDYGARHYAQPLGRWIAPDTIVPEPGDPQALNRYSYVNNRPTVLIDPTGHVAHPNCQGAGAAIADCGVDDWYGYEDYAVRKHLREMGQREGDKVARALLDVVSTLFEPADYAATIGACLSGDCSLLALAAMALPVVPGVIGRNADEAVDIVKRLDAGSDALPARIYRGGDPSPSNLRPRAGEEGLSFRDSLSNPHPLPDNQRPVFEPGKPFFGIDTSGLPPGSVIPDNVPPGHVTVIDVAWEILKSLVVDKGKFPK